jgi:hypothetical protein
MTHDKLPKEIQEQIKKAAQDKLNSAHYGEFSRGYYSGEISGATAWAHWKVKHDELQAAIDDKIDKALHAERNAMQAKMTEMEIGYLKQAQRMADALEFVKDNGLCSETTTMINEALQQFKDGKGKEADNG